MQATRRGWVQVTGVERVVWARKGIVVVLPEPGREGAESEERVGGVLRLRVDCS